RIVSHSGSHYAVEGAGWNDTLAPGATLTFGFVASPGHVAAANNFVLNGVPLGGSSGGGQPPARGTPPRPSAPLPLQGTSDWGTGFTADLTVRNTGSSPLANWTVQFDYAGSISSIWNASLISHVGSRYVIGNASWNATLAPGAAVTVGFTASTGSAA